MLKVDTLKKQIKQALTDIYKPAVKEVVLTMFPNKSKINDEIAEKMADAFDELTSDAMAEALAKAIDYYVHNIDITGTIITVGSPATQTAKIVAAPMPITAGKIPNTLGIS